MTVNLNINAFTVGGAVYVLAMMMIMMWNIGEVTKGGVPFTAFDVVKTFFFFGFPYALGLLGGARG